MYFFRYFKIYLQCLILINFSLIRILFNFFYVLSYLIYFGSTYFIFYSDSLLNVYALHESFIWHFSYLNVEKVIKVNWIKDVSYLVAIITKLLNKVASKSTQLNLLESVKLHCLSHLIHFWRHTCWLLMSRNF